MSEKWLQMKELGNVQFKQNNYTGAADYYTRGIQLNSSEPVLYANRGTCMKLLGKYKESINDYNKAVKKNQKNTKNLKKLSSVYIILGDFGHAQLLLEKCCNLEPSDSSFTYELNKVKKMVEDFEKINEKYKEKKWEDAEEKSKELLKEASAFIELQKIYIQSCLELCKFKDVINYITNTISPSVKLRDWEFNFLLAKTYYFKGDYDLAKNEITKLIKQGITEEKLTSLKNKVETINSLKTKANTLFKENKYEEAINEYTKLIEFDPENKNFISIILTNRALCYKKQGKNMEAMKDADDAIQNNPNYSTAYIRRALIYEEFKMFDDAKADLSKAKELDPSNPKIEGYINEANQKAESAKNRDYYQILGIDRNASADEIKKAYRKLALKYHPDRNSESEQSKKIAQRKFEDVSDAYSVLSDPKKKQMFDQGVDPLNPEVASGGGPGMNFHFSGGDPSEIFKMFFGGEGGDTFFKTSSGPGSNFKFFTNMGGNGKSGFSQAFEDEDDFGSFFSSAGGSPFESFFQRAQGGKKKKK